MKCKRCGQCCETMALGVSPKKMKQDYENWLYQKKDTTKYKHIEIIFPMLLPLSYDRKIKRWRYKCKHLIRKGKIAICSIYSFRPSSPCKCYGQEKEYQMGITGSVNRKFYPNCVF